MERYKVHKHSSMQHCFLRDARPDIHIRYVQRGDIQTTYDNKRKRYATVVLRSRCHVNYNNVDIASFHIRDNEISHGT